MVGTATSGRRREKIPTGKEAEEELRRIKRQQRRAARAALKKKAANDPAQAKLREEWEDEAPPLIGSGMPKTAEQLRADFSEAFDELGGVAGLIAWGKRYPKEFYAVWARICIPKSLGDGGGGSTLESMLAQLDGEDGS